MLRALGLLLAALALAPAAAAAATPPGGPCGTRAPAASRVQHVVWIWMENHAYQDVIGSTHAPYENAIARQCGLATAYSGVTHPSLPNYLAATSGTTHGLATDCSPRDCGVPGPSLFGQVEASGRAARSYQEAMPAPCGLDTSGRYAPKHDPAVYYLELRRSCRRTVVPLGTPTRGALHDALVADRLPAFALVTPDLCHDTHDCGVDVGDAWLARWLPALRRTGAFRTGSVAIFVVWDEAGGLVAPNHVPLLVLSAATPPGTRLGRPADHYGLLRTAEDLLGLRPLGAAARARAFGADFGLVRRS